MKHLSISILCICLLVSSCKQYSKQSANEKNILGNWVRVKNPTPVNKNNIVLELPEFSRSGFSFYPNHTFDDKTGYLKRTDSTNIFLGNRSKYRITSNNLQLFTLDSNKWINYKFIKLTTDTLQFILRDKLATFKHYDTAEQKNFDFDEIVMSTSGCYGACPIMSIALNKDGSVLFKGLEYTGKKGLFIGKITKDHFQLLQENFLTTNFDSLKHQYIARWTDDETISTTFIKNGKIYKTISDYGRVAPFQFTWAYNPVRYLYQQITLKGIPQPESITHFNYVRNSSFKVNKKVSDLTESETFLLFNYLKNGTCSTKSFKNRFKLHTTFGYFNHVDIDTDGRFYKSIVNGKSITIDIGFNFYDLNEKNWSWRAITEYD